MSNVKLSDWIKQSAPQAKPAGVKIGFFKIPQGASTALVRFNVVNQDSVAIATIHKVQRNSTDTWHSMAVSCLGEGKCPLCEAAANGDVKVEKVKTRAYIQALVRYQDPVTKQFSAEAPVIWERSAAKKAGFLDDILSKLEDCVNAGKTLKDFIFKVTKRGEKLDTTYIIDYANTEIFDPTMISTDFSVFDSFNIAKHSYWEKTAEECKVYLETGAFPEVKKEASVEEVKAEVKEEAKVEAKAEAKVAKKAVEKEVVTEPAANAVKEAPKNFNDFDF